MHPYHQVLHVLLQPFVKLRVLDIRTLNEALHLPTHHQLRSTQLLHSELNLWRSYISCDTSHWRSPAPKIVAAGVPEIVSLQNEIFSFRLRLEPNNVVITHETNCAPTQNTSGSGSYNSSARVYQMCPSIPFPLRAADNGVGHIPWARHKQQSHVHTKRITSKMKEESRTSAYEGSVSTFFLYEYKIEMKMKVMVIIYNDNDTDIFS